MRDEIDFRFQTTERQLRMKIRRGDQVFEELIEKEEYDSLGLSLEEFRVRNCGDDCIFCFVDQNPSGLRQALYFRDGDFRMSFLYGNYITLTNMTERDMNRIVEQRLTPIYISVHCTDDEIRRKMMGHKRQKDGLMDKLHFFRDHNIEMHTQIVLVPGHNDGEALERTINDLYALNDAIQSVSIVPVGLTGHRQDLNKLRPLTSREGKDLVMWVKSKQEKHRAEIGRGFVYCSDEVFLHSGVEFPQEDEYDGYPLMENGVGMCRDFLNEFEFQSELFPEKIDPMKLTFISGELAGPLLRDRIKPVLDNIDGLEVDVIIAENQLFGRPVTVSGLLSFQCFSEASKGKEMGDLVVLPPDSVNFEGFFLDNKEGQNNPEDLASHLGKPVVVFDGNWIGLIEQVRVSRQ